MKKQRGHKESIF